ncbi:MAG: DNA repair protein RadC [Ammonifex sp.]|nr:MAG: DNA repair protein RadC [Ammonifex sp.]
MYEIPVYRIQLVKESSVTMDPKKIESPEAVAKVLQGYLAGADREHFVVVMLDTQFKIIGINTVSIGTLDSAPVHPREVFKPAVACNAAAVIVGHNHSSGDPTPTRQDVDMTKRLIQAGEILGIEVLDHIIIGDGTFISLKAERLL